MIDIVNGLLLREGHVLMAHRALTRASYPNTWSFPGGHVEVGETLDGALKRELLEEIGVLATSWSLLETFEDHETNPEKPVRFHLYAVDEWQGEPVNIGDEHTRICWVRLEDAARLRNLAFSNYADLFGMLATG